MKFAYNALMAFLVSMMASPSQAEVHDLVILRYGYLPEVLYVQPGDTIRVHNQGPNWARLFSANANDNYSGYNYSDPCSNPSAFQGSRDGWWTNWIPYNGTLSFTVWSCMETEIEAPDIWQYYYYNGYNEAYIVFGEAPRG